MKLLADTQILLRAALEHPRLSASASELLLDPKNEVFFSAASIWEIAIKTAQGRADFQINPSRLQHGLIESGYTELSIIAAHGIAASTLPLLHKDPFDRILIGQAIVEQMLLLTTDTIMAKYPGPIKQV